MSSPPFPLFIPSLPGRNHLRPVGPHLQQQPYASISQRLAGRVVLLTGATGATGRLIAGALHARGARVRALVRPATARDAYRLSAVREICPGVEIAEGDLRDRTSLAAAVRGCDGCICASGTRNFEGNDPNRPQAVDLDGVCSLAELFTEVQIEADLLALLSARSGNVNAENGDTGSVERGSEGGKTLVETSRFVLISSIGVTRPHRFPQLEQMGSVLSFKAAGEEALRNSGCPFTIVRPGGLRNDPAGMSRLLIDQGDRLVGFVSRADVADIAAEALFCDAATNVTFEIVAAEGTPTVVGPQLFEGLRQDCD